ncbi:MAG: hypothetical protein KAH95_02025 [Spirochaetales bacterium]|nr:hypothetical protein [Spirochaetales bacterium]
MPYENENQRRIGEFLIEMNILSFEQVLSILVSGTIPEDLVKSTVKNGISLSRLNDLKN